MHTKEYEIGGYFWITSIYSLDDLEFGRFFLNSPTNIIINNKYTHVWWVFEASWLVFEHVSESTFIIEGIYIIAVPHAGSFSVKAGFPLANIFRVTPFFFVLWALWWN